MSLDPDVFRILAVLATEPATSGAILDRIQAVAPGQAPPMATFYRRLKHAVDEGWVVVAEEGDGEAAGPGRPGRVFRLTESGLASARAEAARQRSFAELLLPGDGIVP